MSEVERIRDQFTRVWEGDPWHGPNILEILGALTAAQAMARPIVGAHSIWEIVLHMRLVHELVIDRLRGNPAKHSDTASWPKVEDDDGTAWAAAQGGLVVTCRTVLDEIARLDDTALHEPILEGFSTRYDTLHGLVQHDLYHAGQIAILKKAFE